MYDRNLEPHIRAQELILGIDPLTRKPHAKHKRITSTPHYAVEFNQNTGETEYIPID
jgi:hypothetical protein